MNNPTELELSDAHVVLLSLYKKCQKASESLKAAGASQSAQLTLLEKRMKALQIAMQLIKREIKR